MHKYVCTRGVPCSSVGVESACNAGDPGSIPRLGRSPGEGNGNPFQYSCLENPMDRGAWWATVHGSQESDTTQRLSHHHQVCAQVFSHVWVFVTPWTLAPQVPLSMEFSSQEYWSGLPSPPGDLSDPEIKPLSPASLLHWQADSLPLSHGGSPNICIGSR